MVVALRERVLHGVEERVNHQPAFPLGDSWSNRLGDLLNEIGFGHSLLLDDEPKSLGNLGIT